MIKKLLQVKPRTYIDLYDILYNTHTHDSLKSELDFMVEIGKIILVKNKYKII